MVTPLVETWAPCPRHCLSHPVLPQPRPSHTSAVAVVIFVPPEAPTTILTFFALSTKMEGHIEDMGCLPVGDTDTTEAQLLTCSSQTALSCFMSKPDPHYPPSWLSSQVLFSPWQFHYLLYPSPCSCSTKLNVGPLCRGLKVPSTTGLCQLGLSVMQLPPVHYETSLPALSPPCPFPKCGLQEGSRIPASSGSNQMGLQGAVGSRLGSGT